MPQRAFATILSADLPRSRDWYVSLFDYSVAFDSDWFVQLQDPVNDRLEIGILDRHHDLVPTPHRSAPAGTMLTIVVDDVDQLHSRAQAAGITVVEEPRDLFYGQRRLLLRDPDGLLVDVSSECPPDPAWLESVMGA